jgi:hypothetical protein
MKVGKNLTATKQLYPSLPWMHGSPFVYIHIYQAFFGCGEFLDCPVDSLFFMQ